jgi:hypothetical protein
MFKMFDLFSSVCYIVVRVREKIEMEVWEEWEESEKKMTEKDEREKRMTRESEKRRWGQIVRTKSEYGLEKL